MNTPQFHQSEFNDDIVDYINLSAIEDEKLLMDFPEQGYSHPISPDQPTDLEQLTNLLILLKSTHDQVFQVKHQHSHYQIKTGPAWEGLMRGSPRKLSELFLKSTQFSVHPYLWHYLNNFGDLDMNEVASCCYSNAHDAESLASHLNDRVESLRTDLRSHHTARSVDNHHRGYRSNLASLSGYVSDLFKRYSRLLVVRLDFGYRQGLSLNPLMAQCQAVVSSRPEYGFPFPQGLFPLRPFVGIHQIRHHRDALLDFIRHTFGPDFCGFAWKLEYGARKGYHFHVVLFFNGANLRKDVAIGALIGNHWNSVITADQGNYYNCNASGNRYRHPCIGSQSWNNPGLQEGMGYLCAYLTKPDLYARLELGEGQRTFGRGVSPLRDWDGQPRRGRPRTM